MPESLNVLGLPLQPCSLKPLTGYFRDGRVISATAVAAPTRRITACTWFAQ